MDLNSIEWWIDVLLYVAYIGVAVAAVGAILLPLITSLVTNPKGMVKSLIGLGVLTILFVVGWTSAGNETLPYVAAEVQVDAGLSKVIGGSLIMMYILGVIAILGIIFTEISKIFK